MNWKVPDKSTTSGKAGGLTEVERLKAAELAPVEHALHIPSVLPRNRRSPSIMAIAKAPCITEYPPVLSIHLSPRAHTFGFSSVQFGGSGAIPRIVELCESSGRAGGLPFELKDTVPCI